jgi:hypothetical protein
MTPVLAQLAGGSYSIVQMVVMAIVLISVVGIAYVVAQANGVAIPPWVVRIFWIVVIAVVAIFAVRLIMGMA